MANNIDNHSISTSSHHTKFDQNISRNSYDPINELDAIIDYEDVDMTF